jgi:hypothetical protein
VYLSIVACAAACAQERGDYAQEQRNAIGAQRKEQAAVLDLAERACYERFATSTCLIDVARQRRAMLTTLQRREAALDTADRQWRAREQRKSLQARQDEAAAREQALDPQAIESTQQEKLDRQAEKVREHAAHADTAPAPAPKSHADQGLTPEQRAANQAAFDRKQAEAARRLADRQRKPGQASDQSLLSAPAVSR